MRLEGAQALRRRRSVRPGRRDGRELAERGARVAIVDLDGERAAALASELGDEHVSYKADVTSEAEVEAAVEGAVQELGGLRFVVVLRGDRLGRARRRPRGPGQAASRSRPSIRVNLIGTFNVLRYAAAAMSAGEPDDGGERGAVVMTASIAAFDGQIGQTAYSASKGGVVGLTLPAARDLARQRIRVNTIAPGLFDTPLLAGLPERVARGARRPIPHPARLGDPAEYAALACHIAENPMLNGETIRLDGALRMAPK